MNIGCGLQFVLGFVCILVDIFKIDVNIGKVMVEFEVVGIDIVSYLSLCKQKEIGWYDFIGGIKVVKGVVLIVECLFIDLIFVDDINSNCI